MTLDYAVLWFLTVLNTLGILLLVRQLAARPDFDSGRPRIGGVFDGWTLRSADGHEVVPAAMPKEYVMLAVAHTCKPCHRLLDELTRVPFSSTSLVIAADIGLESFGLPQRGLVQGQVLTGMNEGLRRRLQIPGTPFAVAIRDGRVVAAGPAPTPQELVGVAAALAVKPVGI